MVEKKVEGKEEVKISEELRVVETLPQIEVNEGMTPDGKTKINFITVNEALTEILTRIRRMDKAL